MQGLAEALARLTLPSTFLFKMKDLAQKSAVPPAAKVLGEPLLCTQSQRGAGLGRSHSSLCRRRGRDQS